MFNIPIETTQDVLFLGLTAGVVLITLFICWTLYYLILNLRDLHAVTHDVRRRVEKFWEVIDLVREKLQVGGAVFTLAARGIKELADYVKEWTEQTGNKKPRKKKTDSESD